MTESDFEPVETHVTSYDGRGVLQLLADLKHAEKALKTTEKALEIAYAERDDARTTLQQINSDHPTPEAYEAACAALWKHRERADKAEAALAEREAIEVEYGYRDEWREARAE